MCVWYGKRSQPYGKAKSWCLKCAKIQTVSAQERFQNTKRELPDIRVSNTHMSDTGCVHGAREQAIDELRSTSSDQEASEIKYVKTMNISKL